MKIRELPVYERPREKMVRFGRSSLSNGELLAILLRTGTKEKTALRLADDILSLDPNGLLYLQECSLEELAGVKGIGLAKACQIGAAVELGKRIATMPREERNIIKSTQDVADVFMEKMRYYKKEHFDVLLLDAREISLRWKTLPSVILHPASSTPGRPFRAPSNEAPLQSS